jgi:chemotaxis signal transduction protein
METADDNMAAAGAERRAPADLAQLMAAARASTVDAMERLLETAQTGELSHQLPAGTGYLRFVCAGRECAVPLLALREVLPAVPQTVYLPFSPDWMLGIFPLRNEMLGLVDPVPYLTRHDAAPAPSEAPAPQHAPESVPSGRSRDGVANHRAPATALVVGSEDRCLAWAVESVGDIALVQDDELHRVGEQVPRIVPFARRYVAGMYTPRESNSLVVVLAAETLLTDLLDALEAGSEEQDG